MMLQGSHDALPPTPKRYKKQKQKRAHGRNRTSNTSQKRVKKHALDGKKPFFLPLVVMFKLFAADVF
jgi:hypothetical protein